ncbi:MAG: penicillin-binding transpeptidase domain-containing protein, partial [Oscillospiraceae bacterium]
QELDSEGNVLKTTQPQIKRNVITKETSAIMDILMERVVGDADGSGRFAYVPGYRVGGKTGTSEKLDAKEDGQVTRRVSSFLGVAPSNAPEIAVLIMLDEPHMDNIFGSIIAAPVVGAIMADILPYLGVEPQYNEKELAEREVKCPQVCGYIVHDAISEVVRAGFNYKLEGEGTVIKNQLPRSGEKIPKGSTVILYTDQAPPAIKAKIPDVSDMTAEQARRTLLNASFNLRMEGIPTQGHETIKSQFPPAGTMADSSTVVIISYNDSIDLPEETPHTHKKEPIKEPTEEPKAEESQDTIEDTSADIIESTE